MFHNLNKTEYGSDNTYSGRVPGSILPDSYFGFGALLLAIQIEAHHFPKLSRIGSIRSQIQGFDQERIVSLGTVVLKGSQTIPARAIGRGEQLFQNGSVWLSAYEKCLR